jgi:hypothetical protein
MTDNKKKRIRKPSVNVELNRFLNNKNTMMKLEDVIDKRGQDLIDEYLLLSAKGTNIPLKQYAFNKKINEQYLRNIYERTRGEKFRQRKYHINSSNNIKKSNKDYINARTAIHMNNATEEQIQLYNRRQEGFKKSYATRILNNKIKTPKHITNEDNNHLKPHDIYKTHKKISDKNGKHRSQNRHSEYNIGGAMQIELNNDNEISATELINKTMKCLK